MKIFQDQPLLKRALIIGLLLLDLLLPVLFQTGTLYPYLIKKLFFQLAALVIFSLLLFESGFSFKQKNAVYAGIILFISQIPAFFSSNSINVIDQLFYYVCACLLFAVLTAPSLPDSLHAVLLDLNIFASAFVSIYALLQFLWPDIFMNQFLSLGKAMIIGTLGNSNILAFYLAASIPFTVQKLFNSGTLKTKAVFILILIIQTAGLYLSRSKTAWLAFAGAAMIMFFLFIVKKKIKNMASFIKKNWPAAAIILTVSAVMAVIISGRLMQLHTFSGRVFIWQASLAMIGDYWLFGTGFQNFGYYFPGYQYRLFSSGHYNAFFSHGSLAFDAHNQFLHFFAEGGILIFLLFTAFNFYIAYKIIIKDKNNWFFDFTFIMLIISMLFNTLLHFPPLMLIYLMIISFYFKEKGNGLKSPVIGFNKIKAAASSVIILFIIAVSLFQAAAGRFARLGDICQEKEDFNRSENYFKQALFFWPNNGHIRMKYALTLFFEDRFQESLSELDLAGRTYSDIGIPYLKADILTRMRNYDEAVRLYRYISASFPSHITPYFMLGQIYKKTGDIEAAKIQLIKAVTLPYPSNNLKMNRNEFFSKKEMAAKMLREMGSDFY